MEQEYCWKCGEDLSWNSDTVVMQMMLCEKCGEYSRCTECGTCQECDD